MAHGVCILVPLLVQWKQSQYVMLDMHTVHMWCYQFMAPCETLQLV